LRDSLDAQAIRFVEDKYRRGIRQRHSLEQEVKQLEARPKNEGRTRAVRLLKRRLGGGVGAS
jgi:hypothetical protein